MACQVYSWPQYAYIHLPYEPRVIRLSKRPIILWIKRWVNGIDIISSQPRLSCGSSAHGLQCHHQFLSLCWFPTTDLWSLFSCHFLFAPRPPPLTAISLSFFSLSRPPIGPASRQPFLVPKNGTRTATFLIVHLRNTFGPISQVPAGAWITRMCRIILNMLFFLYPVPLL